MCDLMHILSQCSCVHVPSHACDNMGIHDDTCSHIYLLMLTKMLLDMYMCPLICAHALKHMFSLMHTWSLNVLFICIYHDILSCAHAWLYITYVLSACTLGVTSFHPNHNDFFACLCPTWVGNISGLTSYLFSTNESGPALPNKDVNQKQPPKYLVTQMREMGNGYTLWHPSAQRQ